MTRFFAPAIVALAVLCCAAAPAFATPPGVSQKAEFEPFSHGIRLGYMHMMNHTCSKDSGGEKSTCDNVADAHGVQSPDFFLFGYELVQRVQGSAWLSVLFVENIMLGGLEQSLFIPNANALVGFEFANQLQVGVGVNALPTEKKPVHMIMAIGWTPPVGNLNVPVHFAFIPDVDGQHRFAATVGVNW